MATAKHRAIDSLRRTTLADRKHEDLGREMAEREMAVPDLAAAMDDNIGDDMLRLVFIACHPVLSTEARVALTLRLLGGLTTDEIARAYLVAEPTIAQRIVRAKRTLSDAQVPFEVPRGAEFTARLSSVLQVIYLIFNEGYSATAGDDWLRPALCEDALRLGRILAELVPRRGRGARTGCADGDSGIAGQGARGAVGRADSFAGAESRAVGPVVDSSRAGGAGARDPDRRAERDVRDSGGDCSVPRPSGDE